MSRMTRNPEARSAVASVAADATDRNPARDRILAAAGELFAERGFDATPTSLIAERGEVPKGLIHYYFRRKQDLLAALVDRLPDETVAVDVVAVPGDVRVSLLRLVAELDQRLESSLLLSHLLWREADTHTAVRDALRSRFDRVVAQIRAVIECALPGAPSDQVDVRTASVLLARAIHHRHSVSRHTPGPVDDDELRREIDFIARGLGVPGQ